MSRTSGSAIRERDIFEEYLRTCIACAASCDFFDVFGHIGYVSKFCPADDKILRYSDYSDALDALLKMLVQRGKGIEVNTSGLAATSQTMPETAVIARYHELGGEIITVGSDAHTACGGWPRDSRNTGGFGAYRV